MNRTLALASLSTRLRWALVFGLAVLAGCAGGGGPTTTVQADIPVTVPATVTTEQPPADASEDPEGDGHMSGEAEVVIAGQTYRSDVVCGFAFGELLVMGPPEESAFTGFIIMMMYGVGTELGPVIEVGIGGTVEGASTEPDSSWTLDPNWGLGEHLEWSFEAGRVTGRALFSDQMGATAEGTYDVVCR